MSANSTNQFPAPVGGAPDALDFAPSVLFAVLYALMAPVIVWRMVHPRSRNTVLLTTSLFSLERVVLFSFRAHAARNAGFRESVSMETYFQASASGGFISIGHDVINVLRALLVASTLGSDMLARHTLTPAHARDANERTQAAGSKIALAPRTTTAGKELGGKREGAETYEVKLRAEDAASSTTYSASGSVPEFPDQTKLRGTFRAWFGVGSLLFLTGIVVSSIAGAYYKNAIKGSNATLVRSLWYASTVLAIVLLVAAALAALFACYKLPRVPRASAVLIILVACLLSIVGIYRITVISHSTTSLFSTAPGAQNSPGEKAAFYVLHVAPEFVATAILVSLNARRVFGTGPWGDLCVRDPKTKTSPELAVEGGGVNAGSQV